MKISDLPAINAGLNTLSTLLLIAAYVCIRRGKIVPHATLMIGALLSSAAFLTCYLVYHYNAKARSIGLAPGPFKTAYLIMLATHVVLAIVILPMIAMVLTRAARRQWDRHVRIARPTFFIWLYVSITGVLIYVILYHIAPPPTSP